MKLPYFAKNLGQDLCRIFPGSFANLFAQARSRGILVKRIGDRIDIHRSMDDATISVSVFNAVYLVDMVKHFEYYFDSCQPVPRKFGRSLRRWVDFSSAKFQKVSGFADYPLMCPSLVEPYITSQQYLDFAQLKEGDIVLDFGAYSGLTSIAFARHVGLSGRVFAIEADPKNQWACEVNFTQEALFKKQSSEIIKLIKCAVGGVDGPMDFSSEGAMGGSFTDFVGSRGDVIKTPCLKMSTLAELEGLTRVDFVKMDIEGAEEMALEGADVFFKKYRPKLIIEPHVVGGILNHKKVMSIMDSYGYHCALIKQTGVDLPLVTASPK